MGASAEMGKCFFLLPIDEIVILFRLHFHLVHAQSYSSVKSTASVQTGALVHRPSAELGSPSLSTAEGRKIPTVRSESPKVSIVEDTKIPIINQVRCLKCDEI
jgi:hypothetical protein